MKDLIIVGASGFGREVAWLVERINQEMQQWNILGFIDDNKNIQNSKINSYPVLGNIDCALNYKEAYFVVAVGSAKVRKKIVDSLVSKYKEIKFATLIDPSVKMSHLVEIGEGTIICADTIITVNVSIGNHVNINLDCTVGHDAIIDDFVTLYPSVNVSGMSHICNLTEIGTGSNIIQGKTIGANSIIGAGSVVIKDIPDKCTAVGSPAKPIKFFD